MRYLFCIIGLCFSFISSSTSFAQPAVSKIILDNGLTVLIQEMPASEQISIHVCVKSGSALEGKYLGMGIAHFVEHMLFKGTSRRPVGSIAKEVKSLEGTINASTSFDYAIYNLDVPKGHFPEAFDIISDMMMNGVFDPKEIEKERKVIHGEMSLYEDKPERVLSDMVFQNVFIKHPYRHPIIGYPVLFDAVTPKELYDYYKEHYVPNNMILSIAGPVTAQEILPLIKSAFKDFRPKAVLTRNLPIEPPQSFGRYMERYYPTPLIHLSLGYQGVGIFDPDMYALDVLSMALAQGESSRLYKLLYKDKHLVEGISSSNFTPEDRGIFEILADIQPGKLEETIASVKKVVLEIQQKGLTPSELAKTKTQTLSNFVFGNQTASARSARAAVDEAITLDPEFSMHYVELVKAVTNEDIKRVAQRYLQDSHLSTTVIKPKEMEPKPVASQALAARSEIKKIVLANGLTILLQEDPTAKVGSIQLFVHGGTRMDDPSLLGLARLTGRVWCKATQKLSEDRLAELVEQKGLHLGSDSDQDMTRLSFDFMSQDLGFAIDLLEDIVKHPAMTNQAIDRTKQDLLTEIKTREDNIMATSARVLLETLYLTHPMRRDPFGTKESLQKITRKDVVDFYRYLMSPNNMVLAVFGDINSEQVLDTLKKRFGSLTQSDIQFKDFEEAAPETTRIKELHMNKEQALLMIAFQAPGFKNKDRFAIELLDAVLGAGLSGRLFTKVREDLGQAYSTGTMYMLTIDKGTFILYVLTKPDKMDSVKDLLIKELSDLKNQGITQQELEAAKSYLKGGLKRSLTTTGALAFTTAKDELEGLGYDFYRKYDQEWNKVTVEDIKLAVKTYLDITKAAIVTTTP